MTSARVGFFPCFSECTLNQVDAISILGTGDAYITGGGAQEASDKVIQHNGRGTVYVSDYVVVNAGKVYRACGDCTDNGGPRNVVLDNVQASGISSDFVGINSNYGDTATISNSCGDGVDNVCQEYIGVEKGDGDSEKVDTKDACLGDQGQLEELPAC